MKDAKTQKKIVILSFPPDVSGKPIVCNLVRNFDLTFNILKAQIMPRKEGLMTLELAGTEENYDKGVRYLADLDIKVSPVAQRIFRDEESCTHCGMCTAICPNDALYLDPSTRLVVFDKERCTACGLCTKVCPVKAMHTELDNGAL